MVKFVCNFCTHPANGASLGSYFCDKNLTSAEKHCLNKPISPFFEEAHIVYFVQKWLFWNINIKNHMTKIVLTAKVANFFWNCLLFWVEEGSNKHICNLPTRLACRGINNIKDASQKCPKNIHNIKYPFIFCI